MSVNIDFRRIVEILEIDVPVFFTPEAELDRRNYIYCSIIGKDELKAIVEATHNTGTEYECTDMGLHFPDVDVMKYYELEKHRNPVGMDIRIKEITNEIETILAEIPILLAVYCVIHEYGHWIHFKKSNLSSYEYWMNEHEARKPYSGIQQQIYEMPDNYPLKYVYEEKYEREIYAAFPSEKAANNYAMEHFKEAVKKIRHSLGYDEDTLFTRGLLLFLNS